MNKWATLLAMNLPMAAGYAQGAESSFPLEPPHASAVGLGGSGVALSGTQFFPLNPAATAREREVGLSHWASPIGAQDFSIALSHGCAWGTFWIGARRRSWGNVAGDLGLTDLTVGEQTVVFGFARIEFQERLGWGFSLSRLDADYLGSREHAWSMDFGAQLEAGRGFRIGLSLLHFGTSFQNEGTPTPLPTRIRPGVAWKGQVRRLSVLAAFDMPLGSANGHPPDFHAGAEVARTWGMVEATIRGGYKSLADRDGGTSRQTKWSVGGGLGVRQVRADVAYVIGGVFGPERFLTLSLQW